MFLGTFKTHAGLKPKLVLLIFYFHLFLLVGGYFTTQPLKRIHLNQF